MTLSVSIPILVVDASHEAAHALAELLRQEGHNVGVAFDAEQALVWAEELRPRAVFLDTQIPGRDGFWICERLRSLAWSKGVCVFALSSSDSPEDRSRAWKVGFDEYMVKPVHPSLVRNLLKRLRPDPA
jgi:DNA-binding response OmpR family regulator